MGLLDLLSTSDAAHPDALSLMKRDHDDFKDLFARLEETTARAVQTRSQLFTILKQRLVAHEFMEEQVIYPALRAFPAAKELILEALQEHHAADLLVEELGRLAPESEDWGAKCTVLAEGITHHIKEEEGRLFRTARSLLSHEQLLSLGARMARKRHQRLAQQERASQSGRPARTARAASPAKGRTGRSAPRRRAARR